MSIIDNNISGFSSTRPPTGLNAPPQTLITKKTMRYLLAFVSVGVISSVAILSLKNNSESLVQGSTELSTPDNSMAAFVIDSSPVFAEALPDVVEYTSEKEENEEAIHQSSSNSHNTVVLKPVQEPENISIILEKDNIVHDQNELLVGSDIFSDSPERLLRVYEDASENEENEKTMSLFRSNSHKARSVRTHNSPNNKSRIIKLRDTKKSVSNETQIFSAEYIEMINTSQKLNDLTSLENATLSKINVSNCSISSKGSRYKYYFKINNDGSEVFEGFVILILNHETKKITRKNRFKIITLIEPNSAETLKVNHKIAPIFLDSEEGFEHFVWAVFEKDRIIQTGEGKLVNNIEAKH